MAYTIEDSLYPLDRLCHPWNFLITFLVSVKMKTLIKDAPINGKKRTF